MRTINLLCLVFVLILAPVAGSASGQEIKIAHQWAEGVDGRDRAAQVFAREAEARATGLKVRVTPGSPLKPMQMLAALQAGKLDMAVFPLSHAGAKVPEFALAGLPGLVPDLDVARDLKGSPMHTALQALAQAQGIRLLTWCWVPGGFFTKDMQIFGPSSVRGLKMQPANPLFERTLKAAGASVVDLPQTEIAAAMRSDELDAVVTTYESFMSLRLGRAREVCHHRPFAVHGFLPAGDVACCLEEADPAAAERVRGGGGDSGWLFRYDRARSDASLGANAAAQRHRDLAHEP